MLLSVDRNTEVLFTFHPERNP